MRDVLAQLAEQDARAGFGALMKSLSIHGLNSASSISFSKANFCQHLIAWRIWLGLILSLGPDSALDRLHWPLLVIDGYGQRGV